MVRWGVVFLSGFCLLIPLVAVSQNRLTQQQQFEKLAHKMHLKTPKLTGDEYEIRIWNRQGIVFGDAHMLYVLRKTERTINIVKYTISWNGPTFISAKKFKSTIPATDSLWKQLLKEDILTLPDESAIYDKLHPKPQKDSTWNVIEADGSVGVKAKRKTEGNVMIGDGESFSFEVFDAANYRIYRYGNPKIYIRYKPDIPELRKVVAILNKLESIFSPTNQ